METANAMGDLAEAVVSADGELLAHINMSGPEWWSDFWWAYTDRLTWMPLAVVAAWWLLRRGGWQHALLLALCLALMFAMSDAVLAGVLKPLAARLRPSHTEGLMERLAYYHDYRGGRYGFPSNHASNGFAVATLLWLLLRSRWTALAAFAWACGSCYSRLYFGVHYPTDILAGALAGCLFGFMAYRLYKYAYNLFAPRCGFPPFGTLYEGRESWPVVLTLLATVAVCAVAQLT